MEATEQVRVMHPWDPECPHIEYCEICYLIEQHGFHGDGSYRGVRCDLHADVWMDGEVLAGGKPVMIDGPQWWDYKTGEWRWLHELPDPPEQDKEQNND